MIRMYTPNLEQYLHRIAYTGPLAMDLGTLRALAVAHVAAIPFENLNPWLGIPVSLDLDAVERKLVHEGRGGYCFEHNFLFRSVLQALGFEVHGLLARVLWTQPEDAITARSHMLLCVTLEGERWVVDVGFGGMTLSGMLRLQPDVEQATANEPFRLLQQAENWRMQALVRGEWKSLYRFDLQHPEPIDYVVANYYISTYPNSPFVQGLMAARTLADRRLGLRNREFVVHPTGGASVRRTLEDTAEIKLVLQEQFGICLPLHAELDRRLEALPVAGAP